MPPPMSLEEDGIDLYDMGRTIWRRKWFIGGVTLLFTLIAVWVSLFYLPVLYKSEAVIKPIVSTSALKSKLGSLVSLPLPAIGGLGEEEKSLLIKDFLNSRTIKERIIKKYDLLPRIYSNAWDSRKNIWKINDTEDIPTVTKAIQKERIDDFYFIKKDDETGLITLNYLDQDPNFAAKVIAGVINELNHFLEYDYVTDAKRNRIFVEKQLAKAKKELEYWESQIPDKKHYEREILRELEASLAVYTELRKQYELARIEEEKELIAFKVLDSPLIPEEKAKPKRTLICGITLISSGFLAIFIVFFSDFIRESKKRTEKEEEESD